MTMDMTSLDRNIRRAEVDLRIGGTGVLALGSWTGIKTCVIVFINRGSIAEVFEENGVPLFKGAVIVVLMVLLIAAAGMAAQVYIGLSARACSLGKRFLPYTAFATVYMVVTALSAVASLIQQMTEDISRGTAASFIIDLTLIYALYGIIRSSARLKKLRTEHETRTAAAAGGA